MFKEERGITLVALVVTIIVLLILAGVTITLALGSNGVIIRAQEASNTWANATMNETRALSEGETRVNTAIQQYVTGYNDKE